MAVKTAPKTKPSKKYMPLLEDLGGWIWTYGILRAEISFERFASLP